MTRVVMRAGVAFERDRLHKEWRDMWSQHRPLMRFLSQHYPEEWEGVSRCGQTILGYTSPNRPGKYTLRIPGCNVLPFCVYCAQRHRDRRAYAAFRRFARYTPRRKQMRFYHVVMTAPLPLDRTTTYSVKASRRRDELLELVVECMREIWGVPLGGYASYQDFGERGPGNLHPHEDLALNGWTMLEDRPYLLKQPDLFNQVRIHRIMLKWARTMEPGAPESHPMNWHVTGPHTGYEEYHRIMKYQLRELVDLRKVYYRDGVVYWTTYKDGPKTPIPVERFKAALLEYKERLGVWGDRSPARSRLHNWFGYMKHQRGRVQSLFGGEPAAHRLTCACRGCEEWVPESSMEGYDYGSPLRLPEAAAAGG